MIDIKGRTAFVTGGANGIGLAIAREFAQAGAKLALADLDTDALDKAKAELRDIAEVETFILDVSDRDAYASVAEAAEQALGPVTLLFNNAGVTGADSVKRMSYELWDWFIGINLYGVIGGLQAFLPKMIERGLGGHIVNTASGAGLVPSNAGIFYAASKYAVVGLTEELRMNADVTAAGIGISLLCPNRVATDIVKRSVKAIPKSKVKFTEEQENKIAAALEMADQIIHQGISVDSVGKAVFKAVQENTLYIFTDREAEELIKNRTKVLLEAMPD
jgi:NAD(P)-dependent dehydrogenase (short-subunit alcohol dehydrogenase family)